MNRIIIVTFVAISVLFSTNVSAQQNNQGNRRDRHFDREAFEAKRNAFITAEVGLTPEEAAKFIPLCNELRQKKFELGQNCRQLSREIHKKENPTAEEYTRAIDECLKVGIKEAELEKEYFEKFKKVLSPEKIYKYREAEFKFARHFMGDRGSGPERKKEENK